MSESPKKRGRPRKLRLLHSAVGDRLRLRRSGLHERTFDRLRTLIIRGQLAQETEIVEAELCALMGVSRTPLREALKLLAAQGLVELRQNRSARIAPMKADEVRDLFEALSGVERHAAELAAQRMTADELKRLQAMQEKMEHHHAAAELDSYFEINQAIHSAIVAGARNQTLCNAHEWLLGRAERARYAALSSHRRWQESIDEHRGILTALEACDAESAGRLLAAHVQNTGVEVVRALTQADVTSPRTDAA